ncbi:hypothetical protein LINPERHAP1_LOCUS24205, partial [Linum perenne]
LSQKLSPTTPSHSAGADFGELKPTAHRRRRRHRAVVLVPCFGRRLHPMISRWKNKRKFDLLPSKDNRFPSELRSG